jgi:uroporphyrinogen-III synthase
VDGLVGKRVIVTGVRRGDEMSRIVENLGGVPLRMPAQVTTIVTQEELDCEMELVLKSEFDWFIFTTGVGVETMVEWAQRTGMVEELQEKLRGGRVAVRGRKTVKALESVGVKADVRDADGTVAGLIDALESVNFSKQRVMVQLYGMPVPALVDWLVERGATVSQICPYRHTSPDESQMELLVRAILEHQADAVTFTSAAQVQYLLHYAERQGLTRQLIASFRTVIPVAVGRVTAEGLHLAGVQHVVTPKEERMGSMIVSLAKYYEAQPIRQPE